jgi:hypothetical protein
MKQQMCDRCRRQVWTLVKVAPGQFYKCLPCRTTRGKDWHRKVREPQQQEGQHA